jgi:putative two-component system response regulator
VRSTLLTAALSAPRAMPGPPAPIHILVVDDEPNVRTVLRRVLEPEGFRVTEAASGAEALLVYAREGVDLVLSDLMMPGMNGTELLQRVKASDDTVSFIILTGAGSLQNAIEALHHAADDYLLKPFDVDELLHAVRRGLSHRQLLIENRSYRATLEARVTEQAQQIETFFEEAVIAIVSAVEAKDGYTGGHIERVTRYAVAAGRTYGLSDEEIRDLRMAGLLHDVGKIGIPDGILNKPEVLTAAEYEIMKRHPAIGASIIQRSRSLRPALPGVLHHHERWDGSGYPQGLRGPDISLQGRILAVADAFDAMVTARPYRPARTAKAGLAELLRCAGTHFDPEVVRAFVRAVETGDVQLAPALQASGHDERTPAV